MKSTYNLLKSFKRGETPSIYSGRKLLSGGIK
jgi:hypothetical protein